MSYEVGYILLALGFTLGMSLGRSIYKYRYKKLLVKKDQEDGVSTEDVKEPVITIDAPFKTDILTIEHVEITPLTSYKKESLRIGEDSNNKRYRQYIFKDGSVSDWEKTTDVLVGDEEFIQYTKEFFGEMYQCLPKLNYGGAEYVYKKDIRTWFLSFLPDVITKWTNTKIDNIKKELKQSKK